MQLIVVSVIAVLAIIFLVIYNVRAVKTGKKMTIEKNSNEDLASQAKETNEPLKSVEKVSTIDAIQKMGKIGENQRMDDEYRKALFCIYTG